MHVTDSTTVTNLIHPSSPEIHHITGKASPQSTEKQMTDETSSLHLWAMTYHPSEAPHTYDVSDHDLPLLLGTLVVAELQFVYLSYRENKFFVWLISIFTLE